MKFIVKILLLTAFLNSNVFASTMYMLTKLPKAYLVVENYSSKLNDDIKTEVLEVLNDAATELQIDTSGYSHRSLAFILYETALEGKIVLNIELVLGEMVKRVDDENQVFALTYQKRTQMSYENKSNDEIFELTVEKTELLIQDFIEQYKEDNL